MGHLARNRPVTAAQRLTADLRSLTDAELALLAVMNEAADRDAGTRDALARVYEQEAVRRGTK